MMTQNFIFGHLDKAHKKFLGILSMILIFLNNKNKNSEINLKIKYLFINIYKI